MDNAVQLLQTYRGHSKVMRATANVCFLFASVAKGKLATDLRVIGRQIMGATVIERLIDDVMVFSGTLAYGWGVKEKDVTKRMLQFLFNVTMQVYLPVEHITFLCEHNILPMNFKSWFTATMSLLAFAMFTMFVKSLYSLIKLRAQKEKLLAKLDQSEEKSSTLNDIRSQEAGEIVTCVIRALDVLNLVNILPAGVLWGGKLTPRQTAIMGTMSSLIGLYTGK